MTKSVKNIFCCIAICCAVFNCSDINAQSHKGEKSVGLRASYTSRNSTAAAGIYLSYRLSEHYRISPKVDYSFQHNHIDAFSFNIDNEMPIALDNGVGRVNLYPIAGINYSAYTHHTLASLPTNVTDDNDESLDDSSERTWRFGLNLGAGVEFFATPTLRLAAEAKCQLIKNYTGAWMTLSIGYVF